MPLNSDTNVESEIQQTEKGQRQALDYKGVYIIQ